MQVDDMQRSFKVAVESGSMNYFVIVEKEVYEVDSFYETLVQVTMFLTF